MSADGIEVQEGRVINVSATAGCTKGAIWAGSGAEVAGVFLDTKSASSSNTAVPVALEGVFEVTKKAGANLDFAVGEKVYSLTTGGVNKATPLPTGAVPLGVAVQAVATTATTVKVKLCTF